MRQDADRGSRCRSDQETTIRRQRRRARHRCREGRQAINPNPRAIPPVVFRAATRRSGRLPPRARHQRRRPKRSRLHLSPATGVLPRNPHPHHQPHQRLRSRLRECVSTFHTIPISSNATTNSELRRPHPLLHPLPRPRPPRPAQNLETVHLARRRAYHRARSDQISRTHHERATGKFHRTLYTHNPHQQSITHNIHTDIHTQPTDQARRRKRPKHSQGERPTA